jgi:hypothetical protein
VQCRLAHPPSFILHLRRLTSSDLNQNQNQINIDLFLNLFF